MRNIYVSGCHCFLNTPTRASNLDGMIMSTYSFFRYLNEYLKISFLRFSFKVVKMQKHVIRFFLIRIYIHSLPTDYQYEGTMLFTYWPHAWFVNCFIVFAYYHNWLMCQNLEKCVAYNSRITTSTKIQKN